ncbi:MAG: 1-deoxy-D-xylulose-5-phosphate synthase, partial [Puniceicoccales bacterium]|nr:1-deoxy-D-xylulose-5-phosphate synthase [Puniceicoccales bacterium]
MSILNTIHAPSDVKKLDGKKLTELADEIRSVLVTVTSKNGGHLASNLGVVELTIALHRVFDSPNDRIIFDVSHQTYVHKLLTGRNGEKFFKIRTSGGYSGFSDPDESEHDAFIAGHAGTALSIALGFAYSRDKCGRGGNNVVAVLGDASLSCGTTLEALNNLATTTKKLIVIVNDNEFSIDRSVGAISVHVNKILRSGFYRGITGFLKRILVNGNFGKSVVRNARNLKRAIKGIILPTSYFEYYGLRYFGPVDGHDISQLEEILEFAKEADYPVLIHVKTIKGNGYAVARDFPEKFHGIEPGAGQEFGGTGGTERVVSYGDVLGRELAKLALNDNRIVGVVAAMANGTGLSHLRGVVPEQYIDVGIAEEHAVTFSAALAKAGMRPVCAIYSTFLQRAFDQILHDVCLQNLPVIFCLDRAGTSARDGATHHGMFDLSYLRPIPNAVVLQPRNGDQLINALHSAFQWRRPTFIRYPKFYWQNRDSETQQFSKFIEIGRSEELIDGKEICLVALGNMVDLAYSVAEKLKSSGIEPGIINAVFVKPLDGITLGKIAANYELIVTLEDNVLAGGFGSAVVEFYNSSSIDARV